MKHKLSKIEKRNIVNGYLFLLPNFIGFLCFVFIPAAAAFVLAFCNWDAFSAPEFAGLKNFIKMMNDETFRISFVNNLVYTFGSVPLTILLGLLLALALNNDLKFLSAYRVVYFLPYITAMVAVSMIWRMLYHPRFGPINMFLMSLGIENPPGWISSSKWAMPSIILMQSWKNCGYYMVILLAGLKGIPLHLYEAAKIDGTNAMQRFRYVTLPMLSPTMFFVLIVSVINSFKVFDSINIMTEGGPGRSTNVLVFYIYRSGFVNYNFGYASAIALVLFIMIMTMTLIQFRGQKKWVDYA
ncbi:ABC transporter permease [Spirochaetia bacterium]|nr:ABC transporter permease [Spirochaetia bacterium]